MANKYGSMNEQGFMRAMRQITNGAMNSILKRATVIRKIKMFPKNTNQASYGYLVYDEYGNIMLAIDTYYIIEYGLKMMLPKRIAYIKDAEFITPTSFRAYINSGSYNNYEPSLLLEKYYIKYKER